MRNEVKRIIRDEFSDLVQKIESDFRKNYNKKRRNFIISQFDNETTAEMVFVSSFESKSGNTIERYNLLIFIKMLISYFHILI